MVLYICYPDFGEEEYGEPEAVFDSRALAEGFIAEAVDPWCIRWKITELVLNNGNS